MAPDARAITTCPAPTNTEIAAERADTGASCPWLRSPGSVRLTVGVGGSSVGSMSPLLIAALCLVALPMAAQRPARPRPTEVINLSAVLTTFLADSGVPTRGLAWTTGNDLPIRWKSPGPVANPDQSARSRGLTLARIGEFTASIGDSVRIPTTISLVGTPLGLASTIVWMESLEVTLKGGGFFLTREMVEQALRNEGMHLQPLKCSREKEGASYGNLIDAVKAPGKTSSGLWWAWDSPQQRPQLTLTLLYRRADMAQVECYSG